MQSKITVIGLGYIGLPTAVMFASHGYQVHGVDVNEKTVDRLQNRQLHFDEPGLLERLTKTMDQGTFTVSTSPEQADVFILAVPSPINQDHSADLKYVEAATSSIVPYVGKGNLIILESTVPPKTTENIILPILNESGYKVGEELFVAHSPERVIPGKLFEELVSNNRILGGINEESSKKAKDLYQTFVKGNIHTTDVTTAEMVKVVENTYRDVNIAFANELAKMTDNLGVSVWDVIELANCHPRVNVHKPGPGVGGHCIAVDPWFLASFCHDDASIIRVARQINDQMPIYVADRILEITKDLKIDQPKIALLGLAYKGNIDDARESPSLVVADILNNKGIAFQSFDPHIREIRYENQTDSLKKVVRDADLAVVLTDHNEFKFLDPEEIKPIMKNTIILDTKNCLSTKSWQSHGFMAYTLGDSTIHRLLNMNLDTAGMHDERKHFGYQYLDGFLHGITSEHQQGYQGE